MTILIEPEITLRPLGGETIAHFTRAYHEVEHPIIEEKGFDLVGAWTTTSGSVGRLIHLYRFDDFRAYDESRRAIRQDRQFLPTILAAYGPDLTIRETIACGQPMPHVQLDRAKELGPDDADTLYVRAAIRVELSSLPRVVPLLAQVHAQIEDATSMRLVSAHMPVFGDRNELAVYWRVPEGPGSLAAAAAAVDPDASAELRSQILDESIDTLRSMPYSPTAPGT